MKKYIIIAATLIASYTGFAQGVNDIPIIGNKITIGIDGGLSIPSGDFGSTSTSGSTTGSSTTSGFAKLGFCYDIYAGVKVFKLLGVMAQYGGNSHSYDASKLNTSSLTFTSNGGYNLSEYLIGPYVSVKLLKIKIEGKALGGLVTSNYPTISGSSNVGGIATSVVSSFKTGNGFGYIIGAKLKYMMVGGMLGLGVGLNYLGSNINFKGINSQTIVNGSLVQSSTYDSKMGVGLFQGTLGLSLDI